jgi:thioredoxin-related protein
VTTRRLLASIFTAVLALWWLAPSASHAAVQARDPHTHFFDLSFGDLREELEIARAEGKRGLFLMFDDEDCPWCQKMKQTVLNQPRVQEYYRKHFRVLHIDTRGDVPVIDVDGRQMPQKDYAFKVHRVRATPAFLFIGLDGKVLARYTGAARDVEEFLWLAEFVVNGEHKNKSFAVYKRERLAADGGN